MTWNIADSANLNNNVINNMIMSDFCWETLHISSNPRLTFTIKLFSILHRNTCTQSTLNIILRAFGATKINGTFYWLGKKIDRRFYKRYKKKMLLLNFIRTSIVAKEGLVTHYRLRLWIKFLYRKLIDKLHLFLMFSFCSLHLLMTSLRSIIHFN